jgi:hypothetical protein
MTIIKVLMLSMAAFVVTGCGGGSGGGGGKGVNNNSGDFSLAQTTVSFTGELGGSQPSPISITGTLSNASSTVYLIVDASSTLLIQNASAVVSGASSGTLTLIPQDSSKLTIGKHTGSVTVRACKDESCSSQYSGSPKTISVNYEVTAPDYSVTPAAVNFESTQGVLPEPFTLKMTSSKHVVLFGHEWLYMGEPWLNIQDGWSGPSGSAIISVIRDLPVGIHTAKITLYAHSKSLTRTVDVTYTVRPAIVAGSSSVSSSSSSSSSSTSTSTSSSSSSAAAIGCSAEPGDVFIDEICFPWSDMSAYEQNYADSTDNYENTVGDAGKAVRFGLVQSDDPDRGKVIDIKYLDAPEYYGAAQILAPKSQNNGFDMSEYAHGKVVFDLKVISRSKQNSALEFTLECTWPCASTPKFIKTDVLNEWKTYEFSVAELIERGLDIEHLSLGFMLLPTWAKQDGAHFQLDNIRWVKGDAPVAQETVCYSNFFSDQWVHNMQGVGVSIEGVDISVPGTQQMYLTTGVKPWVTANPDWSVMNGTWFYWMSGVMDYSSMELLDPNTLSNCSNSGVLSLEIYTPAALVADGKMTFTLQFRDENNVAHDLGGDTFSVTDMKPDDWNKVSVPLSTAYSNLKYVGIRIDATEVSPTLVSPPFYIDNIVIRK